MTFMNRDFKAKINTLPQKPGVYIFKNKSGKVLYVGKAAHLQNRVKSYFQASTELSPAKQTMVEKVKDIDYVISSSEKEALLLECNLIKKYKPKYNITFKDDKRYKYIRISYPEDYPKLHITRTVKDDGASYFGPFTDGLALKRTLKLIRKIFPYRDCNLNIFSDTKEELKQKACLYYYLDRCLGPCIGKVSKEDYNNIIRQCELFLLGKLGDILKDLKRQMKKAALKKDFEKAAFLRNQIEDLQEVNAKQYLVPSKNFLTSTDLQELASKIGLKKFPNRIECFDISNIQGKQATGSMVAFKNGQPKKSDYRKFKIKTISKANDVGMMREMLKRRLKHKDWSLPDLIIVDGGKPQLNMALKVLRKFRLDIPAIALAKRKEEIYLPSQAKPLTLPKDSKALYLIQRIRDEAHRFAIIYHRKLRGKKAVKSILDEIPGLGPKKKKVLLSKFGTTENIKKASFEELANAVGKKLAKTIKKRL